MSDIPTELEAAYQCLSVADAEADRLRAILIKQHELIVRYSQEREELLEALQAIAKAMDAPRNRFGKIETTRAGSDPLRELACQLNVAAAEDVPHQAFRVARAVIAKVREEP